MKNRVLIIITLIAVLGIGLFILTGCGNKEEVKETNDNGNIKEEVKDSKDNDNTKEEQQDSTAEETTNPNIKIANLWMKLPENIDLVWETDEKNTNNGELRKEYKRGNNIMFYPYSVENGTLVDGTNNAIINQYYYYHYQGDYKWTSYVYYHNKGWDNWYFNGNYPASPQNYSFGRPWTILDNYSDNHETIEIEGLGKVDTVIGTDDQGYTYYYSRDLGFNVKIENSAQSWTLIKYDTKVSSSFPYELPDMDTLDKSR